MTRRVPVKLNRSGEMWATVAAWSIRERMAGGVLDVLLDIQQTLSSKGFQLLSHTSATPPSDRIALELCSGKA